MRRIFVYTYRKFSFFLLTIIFLAAPVVSNLKAEDNSAVILDDVVEDPSLNGAAGIAIVDDGFEYKNEEVFRIEKANPEFSIGDFLETAGIEVKEKDIIFPSKETLLQPGTKIIIKRAMPVILDLYGSEKEIFTQKDKVSEFLTEEQIKLKDSDLVNVSLNDEIFPGLKIKIWEKPKPKPKPQQEIAKVGRTQEGTASWYAFRSGDFAASTTFKKGTKLLVTSLENGRQVVVTVNDYGPFTAKIIDLEKSAFAKLAPLKKGVIRVRVEEIK